MRIRRGKDIVLDVRSAEGQASALAALASELVRLKVSVIVGYQTSATTAAKEATAEIPIVMVWAGDPVGNRLVVSTGRQCYRVIFGGH